MDDDRTNQRIEKLKALRMRAIQIEKDNKQEVFAEHERNSFTKKDEMRLLRKKAEAETLLAKKTAIETGADFGRQELLKYTAEEVEEWGKRQKKKAKRANTGFSDWDEANLRKHKKLISELQPDLELYGEQKKIAETFSRELLYRNADSLAYGDVIENKPSEEAIDKMAEDIEKQQKVRKTHSRRRTQNADSDITYINDRNRRFNQKISRVYDKYTEEIRDNLERGTAL